MSCYLWVHVCQAKTSSLTSSIENQSDFGPSSAGKDDLPPSPKRMICLHDPRVDVCCYPCKPISAVWDRGVFYFFFQYCHGNDFISTTVTCTLLMYVPSPFLKPFKYSVKWSFSRHQVSGWFIWSLCSDRPHGTYLSSPSAVFHLSINANNCRLWCHGLTAICDITYSHPLSCRFPIFVPLSPLDGLVHPTNSPSW